MGEKDLVQETGASVAEAVTVTHTPGPWSVSWEGNLVWHADGANTELVCGLGRSTRHPVVAANARLIAAAPDLLAALQCALFDLEQTYCHVSSVSADRIKNDTIPLARAAIAKAEGRQS